MNNHNENFEQLIMKLPREDAFRKLQLYVRGFGEEHILTLLLPYLAETDTRRRVSIGV